MTSSLHPCGHTLATLTWLACAAAAVPAAAAEYNWTGGTYIPEFTFPQTLVGGDVLNILTSSDKDFHRWNFESSGVVNWSGGKVNVGGTLFGNQAVSQVWNRGDWIATGDNVLTTFGLATFLNTAVFRKEAGAGDTTVAGSGTFANTGGVIDARSGRIVFSGGQPRVLFNDDSKFIGAGSSVVTHGATFTGGIVSDNLVLQGVGARLLGNGATLKGGHLGAGVIRFEGGTFAGSWTVAAGTTLVGADGGLKMFSGDHGVPTDFTNRGTVSWESADRAHFGGGGSVFRNEGTFVFKADATWNWSTTQGTARFVNTGTIAAAAGRTGTIVHAGGDFQNNDGGRLHAAAGATLALHGSAGNQMRFNDGSVFSGDGQVQARGTITFVGNQHSESLNLGGVATGGDGSPGSKAVLQGRATTGGADGMLAGRWEIAAGASLVALPGSGFRYLSGELTNHGTISWQASQNLGIGGGANILTNHGTIDFQTDADIGWNGIQPAQARVTNHGLIVKSAGHGESWLTPPGSFANAANGTLWVRSGAIGLPNGFVNEGLMKGSGTFIAAGLINNGTIAPGNSPGVLTIVGNLSQGASGTLGMELGGGTSFDRLIVDGNFALGGTLALQCFALCEDALQVGDLLTLLEVSGELTGSFASITLSGFGSGFGYELEYDRSLDQLRLAVTSITVDVPPAIPEPETWALMLSGLAAIGFIARRRRGDASRAAEPCL